MKHLFILLLPFLFSCASIDQSKNVTAYPGEELPADQNWLFEAGYSPVTKGIFGVGYIFRSKYGEIIPVSTYSSLHSFHRLILRNEHYQSSDGKHKTGYVFKVFNWAKIVENSIGSNRDQYEVTEKGIGALSSYGGRYIHDSKWSLLYQGSIYTTYEVGTYASLMVNRDLLLGALQYGLLRNHMAVSYKIGYFSIDRRFSNGDISISFLSGIEF